MTIETSCPPAPRLLFVPGLRDSPPGHWQSWLQAQHRDAVRVLQRDWSSTDVDRWAGRIASTLERAGPGPWLAVAHSFGVLAVARHLAQVPDSPVAAALFVAPADPDKFGLAEQLPQQRLSIPTTLVLSATDPWMGLSQATRWGARWGSHCINLGNAGHINVESGFATLPLARRWVQTAGQRLVAARRARAEALETV